MAGLRRSARKRVASADRAGAGLGGRPILRRVLAGVGAWVGVLALVGLAVHPERCDDVSPTELRLASERAVGWFAANRLDEGRYRYRWDRDLNGPGDGYNDVRHAGVMWSLYQAASAGIDGALEAADHGRPYIEERLVETAVGPAFGRGRPLRSGAAALLVSALDERWAATGSDEDRELLRSLGGTLLATIGPDGEVSADIDVDDGPVADTPSPFFTGEVAWALARLHLRFPDDGFDDGARRIRRYVVEERDQRERWFPAVSDHWMGYAVATMATWPDADPSGGAAGAGGGDGGGDGAEAADEEAWLDRQLGLFSVQVRYESQRRGGLTVITRGQNGLAAGVGTLGEGLAGHLAVPGAIEEPQREIAVDRLRCVAGLLVDRQVRADDPRTAGAWFRHGVTQMDDQQHALSALLLTEDLLRSVDRQPADDGDDDRSTEEGTP